MNCGISTACFFPQETAASLQRLTEARVPVTEVFLNTFSEMEDDYISRLLALVRASGTRVSAVHPCSSMLDGFFFATDYEGRFADGEKLYRRYCEICRVLGADRLVFHGDHAANAEVFSAERYAASFRRLAAVTKQQGVLLCHENVSYCRLGAPERVRELRALLREDAAFVLDTKQARRAGCGWREMLEAMGEDICHVHISDYTREENCLPPGRGIADFPSMIGALREKGFDGDLLIELYEDNYESQDILIEAMDFINNLL